jgi:hypothetical protein
MDIAAQYLIARRGKSAYIKFNRLRRAPLLLIDSGGTVADDEDDLGIPLWLIMQTAAVFVVFPFSLLALGTNFWKAAVITIVACAAMLMDFCRKMVVGIGGVLLTVVLMGWAGFNSDALAAWVHHVFY